MARIFPAEFEAQYGVTISTLDSQASTLEFKLKLSEIQESKKPAHLPVSDFPLALLLLEF